MRSARAIGDRSYGCITRHVPCASTSASLSRVFDRAWVGGDQAVEESNMGDDKISPSGFLTVAYFYHLGCVCLALASFYSSLLHSSLLELPPVLLRVFPLVDLSAPLSLLPFLLVP